MHYSKVGRALGSIILVLLLFQAQVAFADTLSVTNNGTASDNTISVGQTNTTTISQNNSTSVVNTVSSTDKTGGNISSANTLGNTSLQTGVAGSSAVIQTSANSNTAQLSPIPSSMSSVTITGNGTGSVNTVSVAGSTQANMLQNNTGSVGNDTYTTQQTGGNTISNTSGSSDIHTGDISSETQYQNTLNKNTLFGSVGGEDQITLVVKGNGAHSVNTVSVSFPKEISILSKNSLSLLNTAICNQNSGENMISGNVGGAELSTGSIVCTTSVSNSINSNALKLPSVPSICQTIPPVTPPTNQVPSENTLPSSSSTTGVAPSSSSFASIPSLLAAVPSQSGQVLGLSVLPSTGANWWQSLLVYSLIGLVGVVIRFSSQTKKEILLSISIQ